MNSKLTKLFDRFALPVLLNVLIGISLSLQLSSNQYLLALGPNLVAGFIGSAATIYGFDYVQKRREQRKLLPAQASAYEDIRLVTHWALDLWKKAYEAAMNDRSLTSWADLLSTNSLNLILERLDINTAAPVHPPMPWGAYFSTEAERIHQTAADILHRSTVILEPEMIGCVHRLVYYNYAPFIRIIAEIDAREGFQRGTNLGSRIPILEDWFDAVLTMHAWTISTHSKLHRHGIRHIHEPYLFTQATATA